MKAIMMSIRPRHVRDILNGDKIKEIRKRFPSDYRGWVYIYVTKGKELLFKDLYAELDPKHRRAFWQNLVSEIAVSQQGQAVAVLY